MLLEIGLFIKRKKKQKTEQNKTKQNKNKTKTKTKQKPEKKYQNCIKSGLSQCLFLQQKI